MSDDLVKRLHTTAESLEEWVQKYTGIKKKNTEAKLMLEAADRIEALEARIAKADALAEAHGKLWSALGEIIEAPGISPNATVRRMAAKAEKALVEDAIADVKPVPRFYKEGGKDER